MQRFAIGLPLLVAALFVGSPAHAQSERILVFATDESVPKDSAERRARDPEMSAKTEQFFIEMIKAFHKSVHSELLSCDQSAFYAYIPAEGRRPLSVLPIVLESSNASRVAVVHIDNEPEVQIKLQYVVVKRNEDSKPLKPSYRVAGELLKLDYPIDFSQSSPPISSQVAEAAHAAGERLCAVERAGSPPK